MELLDRYLQAVKKYLPWQRQDDILAELRANLESQLEEKETELGRPMTKAEGEGWIKQLGSPMQMAARYQPNQYLIGPALFPIYWFVLKMALLWAAVIYLVVNAVLITLDSPSVSAYASTVAQTPSMLIVTAAWITGIFAAIEIASNRYPAKFAGVAGWPANWSPDTLPPIERSGAEKTRRVNFAKTVSEVIFGVLFLIWLLLVPKHPYLIFGPGVFYMQISRFQLAPVWTNFYWAVVGLNILQLAWRSWELLSGNWQKSRTPSRIVFKLLGLIPLLFLINAPGRVLVSLKDPSVDPSQLGPTIDLVNKSVHLAFMATCAIVILTLLWELIQSALNAYRKRAAA
jgi:hypothetical protein